MQFATQRDRDAAPENYLLFPSISHLIQINRNFRAGWATPIPTVTFKCPANKLVHDD
jgi:hypothetical protein